MGQSGGNFPCEWLDVFWEVSLHRRLTSECSIEIGCVVKGLPPSRAIPPVPITVGTRLKIRTLKKAVGMCSGVRQLSLFPSDSATTRCVPVTLGTVD